MQVYALVWAAFTVSVGVYCVKVMWDEWKSKE